jgi:hypothetical protein
MVKDTVIFALRREREMKCRFCNSALNGESYKDLYCTEKCHISYLNTIRLTFWPDPPSDDEDSDTEEFIFANARAGLTRLISQLSSEEKLFRAKMLTEITVDIMAIVYSEKSRDEIRGKALAEETLRAKVRKEVSKRDTDLVKDVEKKRTQELIKKSGEKVSPDGSCQYCHKPSEAEFCSKECKGDYKGIAHLVKMGLSLDAAKKMAEEMRALIPKK